MRTFPIDLQMPQPAPTAGVDKARGIADGAVAVPTTPHVHVFYFKNVRNAPALRARLIGKDPNANFAMLDARTVVDLFQVLLAAARAVHDQMYGCLKTNGVHSEVVYAMSPASNISEAFRRFGVADSTNELAVVKVGGDANEVRENVTAIVEGDEVPVESLGDCTDMKLIAKYYKLEDGAKKFVKSGSMDLETSAVLFDAGPVPAQRTRVVNAVVSAMALKSVS